MSLAGFGSSWKTAEDRKIPLRIVSRHKGRNFGSAALHVAMVASGQLDFVVIQRTMIWDIATVGLLVRRAGGRFTDYEGKPIFPLKGPLEHYTDHEFYCVAAGGKVHRQVLEEIVRP